MADRYFIFVYPEKGEVQQLLDLAIYLINPREKFPAHVTVAGPFYNRKHFAIRKNDLDTTVFSLSRGNFFQYGSNTVFLNVGFAERAQVWKKPDFKGNPIPHLTLYDGQEDSLARYLFKELGSIPLNFSFRAKGLHVVNSVSGQARSDLKLAVETGVLEETRGKSIEEVGALPPRYRVKLAIRALAKIPTNSPLNWKDPFPKTFRY